MRASTVLLVRVAGWQMFLKGRTSKHARFPSVSDFALQNLYVPAVPTYQLSYRCQAPLCLLRKQLHLAHSDDLPARARAVYPKKCNGERLLCGRGVFRIFF